LKKHNRKEKQKRVVRVDLTSSSNILKLKIGLIHLKKDKEQWDDEEIHPSI